VELFFMFQFSFSFVLGEEGLELTTHKRKWQYTGFSG